ncbi:MAG: DNA-directed DNA polymerase II small subunit [Thermoplasmata archaeon]
MVEQNDLRNEILDILYDSDLVPDVEALERILSMPEPLSFAKMISQKYNSKYLTHKDIECIIFSVNKEVIGNVGEDWNVVCHTKEIPATAPCKPSTESYSKLFMDRYIKIKKMLVAAGAKPISIRTLKKLRANTENRMIIGIVSDVQDVKSRDAWILKVEDDSEDTVDIWVKKSTARYFFPDEVVGFKGSLRGDAERPIFYANEVVHPDIPVKRNLASSKKPVGVIFISDIHVGSKTFLKDVFERFVTWLSSDDPYARSTDYLIVTGDLVDGIGIYPSQEDELEIEDIYEQYAELARMLSKIPERIKILAIPGNHDAVRQAEPQPPLPEEITKMFKNNFRCYSNPSLLSIEGVKILLYHGRSFDDLVEHGTPYLSYSRPGFLMQELLKRRHLAPVYGGKTPIAPMGYDALVISDIPDIFVSGHVHTRDAIQYRGVTIINASTWQSQTEYQKQTNLTPVPAHAIYYRLDTNEIKDLCFLSDDIYQGTACDPYKSEKSQ